MTTHRNLNGAGIYIDVENLGLDEAAAKNVVRYALEKWDRELPPITSIKLYGKQTGLWQSAIEGFVTELQGPWPFANSQPNIRVVPTESYSGSSQKNTADIKLAIDACQDMLSGAISFTAVLSNDSDFFALYEKARELKSEPIEGCPNIRLSGGRGNVPYQIINHRTGDAKVSRTMDLVPETHRKILPEVAKNPPVIITDSEIAEAVIQEMDISETFGNDDIQQMMNGNESLRKHRAAQLKGDEFGQFIKESIWPLLENYRVQQTDDTPPTYAMTRWAKRILDDELKEKETTLTGQGNLLGTETQLSTDPSSIPHDDYIDELVEVRSLGGFRFFNARSIFIRRWPHIRFPYTFDESFLRPLIVTEMSKASPRVLMPRDLIVRLYEITPLAKGENGPTLIELAKEVALKVTLDSFTAEDAHKAVANRWPGYIAIAHRHGSMRGPRNDIWFHYNIWPLLKLGERDAGKDQNDMPGDGVYRLGLDEIAELIQRFSAPDVANRSALRRNAPKIDG